MSIDGDVDSRCSWQTFGWLSYATNISEHRQREFKSQTRDRKKRERKELQISIYIFDKRLEFVSSSHEFLYKNLESCQKQKLNEIR